MATEEDENLNLQPAATRELINTALDAVKSQGLDINPYSVAHEAGIAPELLFTNADLMTLVIAARGDQSTFSIDSQLSERCQELEGEMAKLLEINQEIYDRALEMEERVIQLEAKLSDMEQETENLTLQLQNSWHLGYKKGLQDGQSQETKVEQSKVEHQSVVDIELSKEEVTAKELAENDAWETKSVVKVELPKEEKIENPVPAQKSVIDIELPKEPKQQPAPLPSLLDIELPETQKLSRNSLAAVQVPKEEIRTIKSLLNIELPEAEKLSSKSLIDIELPPEEKQSIKSIIDIELPKEATTSQTDFSADKGKITLDNPPVSGDHEPVPDDPATHGQGQVQAGGTPPPAVTHDSEATATYNDRVFNAVSEGLVPGNVLESYGGMSWREVETIYQYSASSGASGPNLVFEPLAPGQAVGARSAESGESKSPESQACDTPNAAGSAAMTARESEDSTGFNRKDTQPIPSRTENQPILASTPSADNSVLPPILKADAPAPRPETTPAAHYEDSAPTQPKINPRSTFTNLTGRPLSTEPDPAMERTMSQFLGDTGAYINLDRVTMEPLAESLTPPPAAAASAAQAPEQSHTQAESQGRAQTDAHTQTQGETQAQGLTQIQTPSQAETQTLAGASLALAAEARARAAAASANPNVPGSVPSGSTEPQSTYKPSPSPAKRDANATYDGLTALETDTTSDVLDLDKLDIFAGMEDIDELNQIEVIEDVIIPGTMPTPEEAKKGRNRSSEHIPVVSSDDLHDLIKSRIKKAEEPHEPPRFDAFITAVSADRGGASGASTASGTHPAAGDSSSSTGPAAAGAPAAAGSETPAPASIPTAKELEALRQGARNKFVGGKAAAGGAMAGASPSGAGDPPGASSTATTSLGASARAVPPEIRKACMILGVRPEDLTLKEVNEKWKAQLTAPGVHPDQGGDTESAIYLNTAKDTLVKWINDQNSKLGKKFKPKDDKDK